MKQHMTSRTRFGILKKFSFESRFYFLLGALVLFIVLEPVVAGNDILIATIGSLVLLSAIDCLSLPRADTVLASRWFGALVLVGTWIAVTSDISLIHTTHDIIKILFLLLVSAALIHQTALAREVTPSVIVGAIDGFLLLGLIGEVAFSLIEILSPGSLRFPPGEVRPNILYFSFMTMTTTGYGDVVPASDAARTVAVLLAITGQLYIAVLVALLVGKFAARKV